MKVSRRLLIAAGAMATLVSAIPIKTECVIKKDLVGNTGSTASEFDQTANAVATQDTDTVALTGAFICPSNSDPIVNMRL